MNGMSVHINTKSKMIVVHYVDAAGIQRRLFILPGEVSFVFLNKGEVSRGHSSHCNEPLERTEDSQSGEGPNIKLLSMLLRVYNSLQQTRAGKKRSK